MPPSREADALAALERSGARWAVLRGDALEQGAGDIDVLVAADDADHLDRALAAAGFARIRTWRHGPHRFFVGYDAGADGWVKLDVVTRLTYRVGRELPGEVVDAVLGRIVTTNGLPRLAPDDEFWALALHCLLDRGAVPPHHLERLAELASPEPGGPLRLALRAEETAAAVVACAAARDEPGLLALRDELAAALPRPSAPHRLRAGAAWLASPLLKAAGRPGLIVAILGPDGAGKSTLVPALANGFYLPGRTSYLGLYGGSRRASRGRLPGLNLARQVTAIWGASLAAAYHRRRGRIIVFDRAGYDALLPTPDGRRSLGRLARELLLARWSPKPDLIVVLDAPVEVLRRRRPEHDLAQLEHWRSGYRTLVQRLRGRVEVAVVDASASPQQVQRQVTAIAWQRVVARRYNRPLNEMRPHLGGTVAPGDEVVHGDR